jgi:hypothetical protein
VLEGASDALVASETAIGLALITAAVVVLALTLAWLAELSVWGMCGVWVISNLLPGAVMLVWQR